MNSHTFPQPSASADQPHRASGRANEGCPGASAQRLMFPYLVPTLCVGTQGCPLRGPRLESPQSGGALRSHAERGNEVSEVRTRMVVMSLLVATSLLFAAPAQAQVSSSVARSIAKYFGKEGAGEATEYMAKKGGKQLVERVSRAAVAQGGDDAVEQVAKLVSKHGPEALTALDNAPSILPVISALSEIPESQAKAALARLAAGAAGRELAESVTKYGAAALRSELQHPGVGLALVRSLGDEGADLASKLSSEQAIAIGRHVDDIAKLPPAQRAGLLGDVAP